ncbi:MAG: type III pantothenate kinase [Clostridia bacterium]|nr:type III pantothenate kinase [Clostridia bacterium]
MLLAIDIGNTHVVLGVYRDKELVADWRISTRLERSEDEAGMLVRELFAFKGLDFKDITAAVIASVVPPLTPVIENMCQQYLHLRPLVVGPGTKTGMPIRYDNPHEVGADRIVNAVAAYDRYGGPVIVVDFGTATTFDAISAQGEYLGGAIAPGIGISVEALFRYAAKLPRVEIVKPRAVIGKNTVSSMQSGIVYGFLGQIEGIVSRMQKELGGKAAVVATGGLSRLFGQESPLIDAVDPYLTLEGLRLIYERNLRAGAGAPPAS